jgi:hypothetical protein
VGRLDVFVVDATTGELVGLGVVVGVGGLTGPQASPSCIGAAAERTTKLEKARPLRTFLNEGIAGVVCVVYVNVKLAIEVESRLKDVKDEG